MDNPSLLVPRAKNNILEIHGLTYKSNEVGKRHPFVNSGVSCKCPLVSPVCFQHVCFSSTKDESLDQRLHKSFKTFPLLREKNLKVNVMQRQGEDFLSLEDLDGEDDVEIVPEIYDKEAREVVRRHREALALQLAMEDSMQGIGQEKVEISETGELTDAKVPDHLLPKVAIVGRPNVGKSALFNRIAGGNTAIVNDEPGVTRDRLYARAYWGAREFMLIDTGGVVTIPSSGVARSDGIAVTSGGGADALQRASQEAIAAGLPSMIERQAAEAVKEASVMILVVDGQTGLSSVDVDIANWLRKKHSDKKLILAVNKCESPKKGLMQIMDFYSLGFEPMAVSAISGKGTGELLDCVCNGLKAAQVKDQSLDSDDRIPAIAIIGRPNVGKSSILNALAGEERTIVSPISGTTRDAIDTVITVPDGKSIKLIDTAGIRRRGRVAATGSKTESLSVNRAFRAIRRSDTVALVIDAMACVTEQDFKLGERIEKEGKGCVIIVNKWDTVPEKDGKTINHYEQDVREKLRILNWAPIVYTSATSGLRVQRILQTALEVEKESSRRLTTATLNQVLQEAVALKQPPRTRGGKKGRIYYCTQAAIRPPTFVFFVNDAKLFPDMYKRYMEKQLRANIGFQGTPIRLLWRSKKKSEKPKSLSTKGAAARS